jgi:hypothetical protein
LRPGIIDARAQRLRNTGLEIIKTQVSFFSPFLFVSQKCAVYELMQKNMIEPGRPQMTIQCSTEKINFAMPID